MKMKALRIILMLIVSTIININAQEANFDNIDSQTNGFDETREFESQLNYISPKAISYSSNNLDFRVNEQVGNSKKGTINSAVNDDGITVVVWYDAREGNSNIYAQLLDAEGNLITENLKINSTDDDRNYTHPSVAVNDENNFLIIWADQRSSYAVYGQLIDGSGATIGENILISDENNYKFKSNPGLDSNGEEFIVSWRDGRNGNNYDIYAQRLNKYGIKKDSNFIVNSDTQEVRKYYPNISIRKDGSFLQTWYSSVEGSNKIFAVIRDSNNNLVNTQFEVTDSSNGQSYNYNPVAANSNNGFVVAWYKYGESSYDIYAKIIDTTSEKVNSSFVVNDEMTSSQIGPAIVSDSVGNFIISWYDYRNGFYEIYSQKFIGDSLDGENIKISEERYTGFKREVSCAMNNSGLYSTSWLDLSDPVEFRIYSGILDSNNTPITENIRVDNDINSSKESSPSIAVFEDGNYVIAWSDERNKEIENYFQIYNADGSPIGSNKTITTTSTPYNPKTVKLMNNTFVLMWREYYRGTNNQYEIIAQKIFSTGEIIGERKVVSSNDLIGNAVSFDVASNDIGEYVSAFQKRIDGQYRIYAQKYGPDGNEIGGNILVDKDTLNTFYSPNVAIDNSGNFAVTYFGNKGDGNDIFLSRYDSTGNALANTIIVNDDSTNKYHYNPNVSVNSEGECIVVWYDTRNIRTVYFQKFNNIGSVDNFVKVDSNIPVTDYYLNNCSPVVSINDNGEFIITWNESDNAFKDIKMKIYNADLTPQSEIMYATENLERNQIYHDLYFSTDKVYNVWQDNSERSIGYDIWANVLDVKDLVTSVNEAEELPNNFSLSQNYPNPFNPTTKIKFSIPKTSTGISQGNVELRVFDILGKEVTVLVNEMKSSGNYEVSFDASAFASGVYFYTLRYADFIQTKKMLLLK